MILNDFTQPKLKFSREKLDAVLVELCSMVIEGQQNNPDFYGMVAAAVLDTKGRLVTGVNYLYGNSRIHAERAAIDKYEEEYGELPKGSIVITTLSPCCEDTHDNRYGVSCTDLLNEKHIKLAYCGYSDPSQDNTQEKFTIIITENSKIKLLCKKLADTFLKKNLNEAVDSNKAQEFISNVYSQYPDWPYGQADKVMVWGEGEDQQFAAFKLKPSISPDTVEIDWIMAGPEQRKGVGSRAIKELQQQAQEAGIKLTLYPWAKGNVSQASLAKLYKRHGFKPIAKGAKPMAWEPVSKESYEQHMARIDKDITEDSDDGYSIAIKPEFEELARACDNWYAMEYTPADIQFILNSPYSKPYRKPSQGHHTLYRCIFPNDKVAEAERDSRGFVSYATTLRGADVFRKLTASTEPYYIIEKKLLPGDFLLNFTSLYEMVMNEMGFNYDTESEVWMKRSPYYTEHTEDEIVVNHYWPDEEVKENFADGKGPGRPGDSQRHGISKGASMSELEKASHSKGRKGQLARWQLNMRRGKKK